MGRFRISHLIGGIGGVEKRPNKIPNKKLKTPNKNTKKKKKKKTNKNKPNPHQHTKIKPFKVASQEKARQST